MHSFIREIYRLLTLLFKIPVLLFRGNKLDKTGLRIGPSVQLRKCTIDKYVSIGAFCSLNHAILGPYCSIGPYVMVGGEEHAYQDISTSNWLTDKGQSETDTVIGHDVWVGAQCYIRAGVKIGNGAVIGANSFVNKDVPDYAIVAGSPAKVIKYRFTEDKIRQIQETRYWEKNPVEARNLIVRLSDSDKTY